MSVSTEKNFYVYQDRKFINLNKLNSSGRVLMFIIADMLKNPEIASEFVNIKEILVTSQDREKRNNIHRDGYAIDVTLYPLGMNLWLIDQLSRYDFTSYISSYNKHIHFDLRTLAVGGYGAEVLVKNDRRVFPEKDQILTADGYEIMIDRISKYIEYLSVFYKIYELENLKIKIVYRLSNPFSGWRKGIKDLFTNGKQTLSELGDDLKKIMIGAGTVIAGILIYKIKK